MAYFFVYNSLNCVYCFANTSVFVMSPCALHSFFLPAMSEQEQSELRKRKRRREAVMMRKKKKEEEEDASLLSGGNGVRKGGGGRGKHLKRP